MDSLTQLLLGACVGHAVLAPRIGRVALVWGAVLGTLPDLDVLIPYGDPVSDFVFHRGFSHSLFVHALCAPLIGRLMQRLHKSALLSFWRTAAAAFFILATHALLDAFTVYGTQIFWPLKTPPESWSTLFIIDPLYTVPLLVGCVLSLFKRWTFPFRQRAVCVGLALSSAYVLWSIGAKLWVESRVTPYLLEAGYEVRDMLSTPSPLNTVLWRIVALTPDGYVETYYSLLAEAGSVPELVFHSNDFSLIDVHANATPAAQLKWFTGGFFKNQLTEEGELVVSDLRMGSEPDYVFSFNLGPLDSEEPPTRVRGVMRARDVSQMFSRIWTH